MHSRLLFLAGSWPKLSLGQFRKLGAAYCRPLRVVANVHRPPAPDSDLGRVSNGAVLDHLKVVPLEWALVFSRLRLVARLSRHGSASVFSLISSAGGRHWREQVELSVVAFAKLLPDKLEGLPHPTGHMAQWEQFWINFPTEWSGLIQLANRRVVVQPVHAHRCLLIAGLVGDPDPPDWSEDLFLCAVCGR